MNWFERHLNWTVFLVLVALYPLDFFLGFLVGVLLYSINPYMATDIIEGVAVAIALIVNFALLFLVGAWALKKKARSLWNLLWFIVPFGLIVFLCLENRGEGREVIQVSATTVADSATQEKLDKIRERKIRN